MFNTISWQAYWITLAFTLTGYYAVVYLLYFRKGVKILPNHQREAKPITFDSSLPNSDSPGIQTELFDREHVNQFTQPEAGTEEHIVYNCMDEINAFFGAAKRKRWMKEELQIAINSILQKYPSLLSSVYKESITNVIRTECEHHCSIHLDVEDLVQVWLAK